MTDIEKIKRLCHSRRYCSAYPSKGVEPCPLYDERASDCMFSGFPEDCPEMSDKVRSVLDSIDFPHPIDSGKGN